MDDSELRFTCAGQTPRVLELSGPFSQEGEGMDPRSIGDRWGPVPNNRHA